MISPKTISAQPPIRTAFVRRPRPVPDKGRVEAIRRPVECAGVRGDFEVRSVREGDDERADSGDDEQRPEECGLHL